MDYTPIGNRIKEIREQTGLNQSQFGKKLNVSQDTISLWERGKSAPAVDDIISIIDNFLYDEKPISADWLLGVKDDRF